MEVYVNFNNVSSSWVSTDRSFPPFLLLAALPPWRFWWREESELERRRDSEVCGGESSRGYAGELPRWGEMCWCGLIWVPTDGLWWGTPGYTWLCKLFKSCIAPWKAKHTSEDKSFPYTSTFALSPAMFKLLFSRLQDIWIKIRINTE